MRFERIDDKTVKCFLSREELEEFDITYKDFITRSDKAREVMAKIMLQAEKEVGYQPSALMFELQIMMLPDQSMILVFSEKDPENMLPGGKGLKDWMNMIKDALSMKGAQLSAGAGLKENDGTDAEKAEETKKAAAAYDAGETPGFAVFAFDRLRDICTFACRLPGNLRVRSELYEMEGIYFLYLEKGAASRERYSKTCVLAMEYAVLYTAQESRLGYLKEHARCLIEDHALQKMKF